MTSGDLESDVAGVDRGERAGPIAVALALAMDRNRLIGRDGALPWHIPGELAHFKRVTLGKPIVMGRRTFDSIGRPLPGRPNIVVTRDPAWHADGTEAAPTLEAALALARERARALGVDELVVIGGAGLCRDAMPLATRFHLTWIDADFDGDTWLDSFDPDEWLERDRQSPDPSTTGDVPIHFLELERRAAPA